MFPEWTSPRAANPEQVAIRQNSLQPLATTWMGFAILCSGETAYQVLVVCATRPIHGTFLFKTLNLRRPHSMLRVQPQKQHLDAITKGSLALPPSTMNEAISSCIVGAARRHHKFNPKKTAVAKMKGSAAAAMGWLGRKLFGNNGEEDDPSGERNGA